MRIADKVAQRIAYNNESHYLLHSCQLILISIEDLKCLDYQIWLRSGEQCARRLFTAQSTVSRRNAETLKLLNLKMRRDELGEWILEGDSKLIEMERIIHQLYRFGDNNEKLRLEATFWAGPILATPVPEEILPTVTQDSTSNSDEGETASSAVSSPQKKN